MYKKWITSVPLYFEKYIKLVEEEDMMEAMNRTHQELLAWAKEIEPAKSTYAYKEDKWTVNEVLQHIIDTERIFQYRSLAIARAEMNELPGFDHVAYAKNSKANTRSITSLIQEFDTLRKSSIAMYEGIAEPNIKYKGMASGLVVQPVLYGFLISGHLRHHLQVLQSRY